MDEERGLSSTKVTFDEDTTAPPVIIDEIKTKRDRIKFLGIVVFYFSFTSIAVLFIDSIQRNFVPGIVVACVNVLLWIACLASWICH